MDIFIGIYIGLYMGLWGFYRYLNCFECGDGDGYYVRARGNLALAEIALTGCSAVGPYICTTRIAVRYPTETLAKILGFKSSPQE